MSIIVKPDDVVEVCAYYKEVKNGNLIVKTAKEFDKLEEEQKPTYTKLSCECKRLSWQMQNSLQKEASKEGADKWDWVGFREKKLALILTKWDAKDDDGNPIRIDPKVVASMHPQIANAILEGYDEVSYLSEEEQKNL